MTHRSIHQGWVESCEAARLARDGMCLPEEEHASCGGGLVAAIDGKPRREAVDRDTGLAIPACLPIPDHRPKVNPRKPGAEAHEQGEAA